MALASIRYGIGSRPTAAITTAAWIDAGLITENDTKLVVDHHKVVRAQEKVMSQLNEEFEKMTQSESISCILFDGRVDVTKVMMEAEGSNKLYPSAIKEEHYSVCKESGGDFLFHFTPEKQNKNMKHAEILANKMMEWMVPRRVDKCLLAIGGDSTNVNTRREGGAIHHVERMIGRRLVWIIFMLHTNKLPLR